MVATSDHGVIADTGYAGFGTGTAFGALLAGAYLVVVDSIVLAVIARREVRHDDVGTVEDTLLASLWVECAERCGGGQ